MPVGAGSIKLSRRELEVAELVADGLTDREIARKLFLSERTAEGHVQSIRNKLGFDTRAQIASWFARRSLAADGSDQPQPEPDGNLPVQLTTFIGRESELAEVRRLLDRTRLVTIAGPGGAGKTRLAVQTGWELRARYPGGIWFGDLGAVTNPDSVLQTLGVSLQVRESEGTDVLEELRNRFSTGTASSLIILDNCEHVIDGCAVAAEAILKGCPPVRILCTSREPLLVAGEAVSRLASLSLPAVSGPVSMDLARRAEAVQLFCDRASLSEPSFELDEGNAQLVAEICRTLDGIPLALELGAAQVGKLGLEGLRAALDEGVGLLHRRGGPARHQTLDAAVRWSYDMLTLGEQRLVRHAAVFRGGFSEEAARSICGLDADSLPAIADRSLVMRDPADPLRWRMLETIRQCAEEWLKDAGEWETARQRHLDHYLGLAIEAEPKLTGPDQATWLSRLAADHDNLRASLASCRERDGEVRLRLPLALYRFWAVRGHLSEGRAWLEDSLLARGGEPRSRAGVLNAAAGIAWRQGEFGVARAHLEAGLPIWREMGDTGGMQACLANLGVVAASQGDFAGAGLYYAQSLELAEALGEARAIAILQSNLGLAHISLGDQEQAQAMLDRSLSAARELREPALVGLALMNLGILKLDRGRPEEAAPLLRESLELLAGIGNAPDLADCLEKLGWLAAAQSAPERAIRLAGAAAGIRRRIGAPSSPMTRRRIEGVMAGARTELGSRAAEVWADGLELTVGDAIELGRQS